MRDNLKNCKRLIIKVGTSTLTYPNGRLNLKRIDEIAWVLADLHNRGKEVILVSSGAIAVGTVRLNLEARPKSTAMKQAVSAVGQAALMQIYENFFGNYNQTIAQVLLTKDVVDISDRALNARNTFFELLNMGVIPVVNENDTVSTDELEFSDNDTLSAYVACLLEADCLIILSDIEGLFDSDPNVNPNAEIIQTVSEFNEDLHAMAGGSLSGLGTGGMSTKITAAEMATQKGIHTVIASGEKPEILFDIIEGKEVGTIFIGKRD